MFAFDLSREMGLPFQRLVPVPDTHLPSSFVAAVGLLHRPYFSITEALYKDLFFYTSLSEFNTDIVVDEYGRQMTFGNADGPYMLMPLMKNLNSLPDAWQNRASTR
jgi:hypothetical protein